MHHARSAAPTCQTLPGLSNVLCCRRKLHAYSWRIGVFRVEELSIREILNIVRFDKHHDLSCAFIFEPIYSLGQVKSERCKIFRLLKHGHYSFSLICSAWESHFLAFGNE